ncbi:unnamed protein product [Schistosoma margrebowiei]|uniref:Uncharacterized protein n=1 Tax=Schistosoma margrebowiei TaxID=48269 RepID=A0A183LQL5_9TREM|nr:unnamed protein product [Schistosoma margrebowiei]
MQVKTVSVSAASLSLDPNIHNGKSNILKYNTANTNTVTLDGEAMEEVEIFTYLDSIIDECGGLDADVKMRIGKANATFPQLKNIWNLKQLSTNTKVTIFNTNINTVLSYGVEAWRTTTTIIKLEQVFINYFLRKIPYIHWLDTISNTLL